MWSSMLVILLKSQWRGCSQRPPLTCQCLPTFTVLKQQDNDKRKSRLVPKNKNLSSFALFRNHFSIKKFCMQNLIWFYVSEISSHMYILCLIAQNRYKHGASGASKREKVLLSVTNFYQT